MKHIQYPTCGTCSRQIDFDLADDGTIHNITFLGGCNGNLQGRGRLCEGRDATSVAQCLAGTNCNGKGTSCPDQLARAIARAMAE